MVHEANVKQSTAEKQLKEALGKVRSHHQSRNLIIIAETSQSFCQIDHVT